MDGYLGSTVVTDLTGTPYEGYTTKDWAVEYIQYYGQYDGGHHRLWVLDQVMRILKGTPVIVELKKWENGHEEYWFNTAEEPSQEYLDFVKEFEGNDEFFWGTGIAP